ncbi:hypothetical protein GOP47_0004249 [Adiantum capillus-veneris]|uniref:Uncharacterized protein n=1 Tax=Adiantum capillus-veneris TaxID=13818 RepID=A0A9D4V8B7_ADICA|nr:hypothetical protein GOP47_0004249 [Adiantum capillus-veneris]
MATLLHICNGAGAGKRWDKAHNLSVVDSCPSDCSSSSFFSVAHEFDPMHPNEGTRVDPGVSGESDLLKEGGSMNSIGISLDLSHEGDKAD